MFTPRTGYVDGMRHVLAIAGLVLASPARAEVLRLNVEGMSCADCEGKLSDTLNQLEFLTNAKVSAAGRQACAELTGALDIAALTTAVAALDYSLEGQDILGECPDITKPTRPGNWAEAAGVDARIISKGAPVDFTASLVSDKFTIFDFGADWCGPCHAAEKFLKMYMMDNPDVAVRAIVLEGKTAKESFKHPVATQHLTKAAGLPYFVVYSPSGKRIYQGIDLPKALKKIDRKRK